MNIAIFMCKDGRSSDIHDAIALNVFHKSNNQWLVKNSYPISEKIKTSLSMLRSFLEELISHLNDCEVIVSKKMLGTAYTTFDRAGYQIWEYEGYPANFLPILEKRLIREIYDLEIDEIPFELYEELGDGCYSIHVKKILFDNPNLTSKKLLLPFLDHRDFKQLEVTFSHIPPWFDSGLKKRGFTRELIEHKIDEHKVIIRK